MFFVILIKTRLKRYPSLVKTTLQEQEQMFLKTMIYWKPAFSATAIEASMCLVLTKNEHWLFD
jgi:hypothetical protein